MSGVSTVVPLTASEIDFPKNHIAGLITSNNATDADHDIDISTGRARSNDNTTNMVLSSVLIKQIDANWAVGSNAGGLDTGTVAADTLYALWLIKRTDTGVVDALFSISFSGPAMPTNYDKKRLIAAVLTDSSSNIRAYVQYGDLFWFLSGFSAISDTTITEDTFETGTLPVPPKSYCIISMFFSNNATTPAIVGYIRRTGDTTTASVGQSLYYLNTNTDTIQTATGWVTCPVNESSQIDYAANAFGDGISEIRLGMKGFQMTTRRET